MTPFTATLFLPAPDGATRAPTTHPPRRQVQETHRDFAGSRHPLRRPRVGGAPGADGGRAGGARLRRRDPRRRRRRARAREGARPRGRHRVHLGQ
ncbi:hypothetical protein SCOCK_30203 [Actinacidiphila cocklensis]|uniref:Uncharacterized protein n=1 Tax=Actinacidiphila cocklensis TaxID=887465 RepID=A0A9W4GSP5_9ACTN|nr:hypothetical protein SCOCK_30203 [Actinacidiphila cocklensis]